ncbi:MAG TPA: pilus assembly protein PilP [Candidatus Binatia bacterium]|jgi:Tfp pilus assembly protein PilP
MTNADTMSAVLGLLLGLATRHPPIAVAAADAAQFGPVVAIDKAKAAAGAEKARAEQHDEQAARIFAPGPEAPARGVQPAASAPQAVQNPAPADQPAAQAAAGTAAAPNAPVAVAATDPNGGKPEKYDPSAHRDPFRPPTMSTVVADTGAPKTPLEGYEIGQLKLVGIVRNGAGVRAMVEDSQGLGYIVTSGTPIGSAGGIVRTIEERRVLIDETTTNFYGEKQAKEVIMELPQEDRSP